MSDTPKPARERTIEELENDPAHCRIEDNGGNVKIYHYSAELMIRKYGRVFLGRPLRPGSAPPAPSQGEEGPADGAPAAGED